MLNRPVLILSLLLASVSASGGATQPAVTVSVASINLCADQLVLLLADPGQIKSVSTLSQQATGSYFYQRAHKYPGNEGTAEEILPLSPDLVIAGSYTSRHTVLLLREMGLRVERLPVADNIESMLGNVQRVADWLGQRALGAQLVKQLQQRLDALAPVPAEKPLAAVYDPNGYTVGAQSLRGQMLALAGWENAARLAGIEQYGKIALEELLRLSPVALVESPYSPGTWSRAQALSQHPALRQAGLNPLLIDIPNSMSICAGPWTVDVIEQLQTARLNLAGERQ